MSRKLAAPLERAVATCKRLNTPVKMSSSRVTATSDILLTTRYEFMSSYPINLCVYSPTRYLFPLIPAVLLRSLVGVVAKGNRVACRRSFNSRRRRRRILFFGWLSFGFLRKEAPHFGLIGWDQITPVFQTVISWENTSKCEAEAYVQFSCQDFFFFFLSFLFPSVVSQPINTVVVVTAANHRPGESDWITWGRRAFVRRLGTRGKVTSTSNLFIIYLFFKACQCA